MKSYLHVLVYILLLAGCKENTPPPANTFAGKSNAIYHWKTVFDPSPAEWDFIKRHDIGRLYIRFFDVVPGDQWLNPTWDAMPVATAIFRQTPPEGLEVVPTVFITLEAMKMMKNNPVYPAWIVERVLAMAKRNKLNNIPEVQLDCDWTRSTRDDYFNLCRVVRDSLHARNIKLSATIRLHQLKQLSPPVDKGVLMLYNTGAIRSASTRNSILHFSDVEQYLKKASYNLPLDFAYPTFAWSVWFRNGQFKAILRTTDFSDASRYRRQEGNSFLVLKDHLVGSAELRKGDLIRLENSSYPEVMKVKQLVEKQLLPGNHAVILYHLDSTNLSKYATHEIENIYSRR